MCTCYLKVFEQMLTMKSVQVLEEYFFNLTCLEKYVFVVYYYGRVNAIDKRKAENAEYAIIQKLLHFLL